MKSQVAENRQNKNSSNLLTTATSGVNVLTMTIRNGLASGRDIEKRRQAIQLWLKGLTYAEIGNALSVSRQRAQQMIAPPRPVWNAIRAKAKGKCQHCGVAVLSGHIHHKNTDGRTLDDFNDMENLLYLCPGCHRKAHSEGLCENPISMRPTEDDWRIIEALRAKLKMKTAKIIRMALRRFAEAEGLELKAS